jgi:hypothetical protein
MGPWLPAAGAAKLDLRRRGGDREEGGMMVVEMLLMPRLLVTAGHCGLLLAGSCGDYGRRLLPVPPLLPQLLPSPGSLVAAADGVTCGHDSPTPRPTPPLFALSLPCAGVALRGCRCCSLLFLPLGRLSIPPNPARYPHPPPSPRRVCGRPLAPAARPPS